MNSQLAGVIDYSFSRAGGMEEDDISNYLRMPILLKSPSVIVDTVMWLDHIVTELNPGESANMAVVNALESNAEQGFMKEFYGKLSLDEDASIVECAPEICKRLDALLIGKLWKKQKE